MPASEPPLTSLFAARRKLSDLIVSWSPDPKAPAKVRAAQARQLNRLLEQRDQVVGVINALALTQFQGVVTTDLLAAQKVLQQTTARLDAFGESLAQLESAVKVADQLVAAAGKLLALAGLP